MPRFNVTHKNKWACFSSIVDGFITDFTDKADYEEWRKCQYGMCGFKPAEECNVLTLKKAVSLIRIHNDYADSLAHLIEVGISKEEAEKMLMILKLNNIARFLKRMESLSVRIVEVKLN